MKKNIFLHENKFGKTHLSEGKKQSYTLVLDHIKHLVSAMQGNTHSPYKTKDAVSNPQIRHLHYSNHARNSYVLLVYTTEKKHFISLSPLVRACVLVIG